MATNTDLRELALQVRRCATSALPDLALKLATAALEAQERLDDLVRSLDNAHGRASVARNQNGTEIGWEAALECEQILFDALALCSVRPSPCDHHWFTNPEDDGIDERLCTRCGLKERRDSARAAAGEGGGGNG